MILKKILELLKRQPRKETEGSNQTTNRETSFPLGKEPNRRIQLNIGIDFGTSFSKVVVGESRVRYAVPFDDYATGENRFLLPSALCVFPENGECRLGVKQRGWDVYDNLKMPLIERDFSEDVQVRAAAFLALMLRHIRTWLFDTHGSVYRDRNLQWFINVGLPTDSYDDEELTSVYLAIVRTAWGVSMLQDNVTLQKVFQFLKQDGLNPSLLKKEDAAPEVYLPDDRFHAFPEFSAHLAGYVQSPRRRDGLHVSVDIGGGTLDITVFNVHENNGEDVYPIFARKVVPFGVRYLTAARLQALNKEMEHGHSPFDDLPSNAAFMEKFGMTREQIKGADRSFRKGIAGAVTGALRYTKQHRYPNAPQWDISSSSYGEPVRSFFCGGGSLAGFYANLLRRFELQGPPCKLRASVLPVPDNLEVPGMTPKGYARLAVAYGLSFDPFDIGQVRRMNEVEDIQAEESRSVYEDGHIGKEQM